LITNSEINIPVGTRALIMSKLYYGVLSKSLESLDIDRYFSVFYFLNENNGCTQQCICNHLAIDKTAMVKVIDSLIAAGYIEKKVNPADRRENFIFLTRKGAKHTFKIVDSFRKIDDVIFKDVSKPDQDTFGRVLCKLCSNLKDLPANDLFFNYKKTGKSIKKPEKLNK